MIEHVTTSRDGTMLSYRQWSAQEPKMRLLIVPGYAEHAGRYDHIARFLSAEGVEVVAMDLRGHGKSGGQRGYVNRFSQYHEDVAAVLGQVKPHFLLGHSMGGLVVLSYLLANSPTLKGVIVTSPLLGLRMKVPPAKALLGRIVSGIYPRLSMPNGIPPEQLSRDSAVGEAYVADPLVFKVATARWFTESQKAMQEVRDKGAELSYPFLIMQAGDEQVADASCTRKLAEVLASKDKTYVEYEGYRHEVFNEIGKEECCAELLRWILHRS
jgi:alpha-beta hydrolase superfamily lysophospholipase